MPIKKGSLLRWIEWQRRHNKGKSTLAATINPEILEAAFAKTLKQCFEVDFDGMISIYRDDNYYERKYAMMPQMNYHSLLHGRNLPNNSKHVDIVFSLLFMLFLVIIFSLIIARISHSCALLYIDGLVHHEILHPDR